MFVCVANAFNLPVAGMLTVVVAIATIFSPCGYVQGLGNIVSPILMLLGNIGLSSSNKSGVYKILTQTIRKATSVLERLKSDSETLILNGLYVPDQSIPV